MDCQLCGERSGLFDAGDYKVCDRCWEIVAHIAQRAVEAAMRTTGSELGKTARKIAVDAVDARDRDRAAITESARYID